MLWVMNIKHHSRKKPTNTLMINGIICLVKSVFLFLGGDARNYSYTQDKANFTTKAA